MANHEDVIANIRRLEDQTPSGLFGSDSDWDFKAIWSQIRRTGSSFKGVKFPTPDEHSAAWDNFQSLVERVKEQQDKRQKQFESRAKGSGELRNQIIRKANDVGPFDQGLADVILTLATGGAYLALKLTLEALLGKFDEQKVELIAASDRMKAAWALLSGNKTKLLRDDKDAVYSALREAQEKLDGAWQQYKEQRSQALDEFHREKEKRRNENQAKHEAWKERTRANIAKNEDWLRGLQERLAKQQSHLSDLNDKYADAWNDDFRERVSGWIDEAHSSIAEIESKIERVEGFVQQDQQKLDDAW